MLVVKVHAMLTKLLDGCLFNQNLLSKPINSGCVIMQLKLISFEDNLAKIYMPIMLGLVYIFFLCL